MLNSSLINGSDDDGGDVIATTIPYCYTCTCGISVSNKLQHRLHAITHKLDEFKKEIDLVVSEAYE